MELKIRQSWDQITLGEYLRYRDIIQDESKSEFQRKLEVVALLANINPQWLYSIPAREFMQLFQTLTFLESSPEGPVLADYTLEGRKYRLASQIEDISTAQFLDLHNFCKGKTPTELVPLTANIIACVLVPYAGEVGANDALSWRPKLEKYLQTPHGDTVDAITNFMPVTEALSISNFFMLLWLGYCRTIVSSSESQKKSQ